MKSTLYKVLLLLNPVEKSKSLSLLLMMVVAMLFETMSIGLVVPAIGLMMQGDLVAKYPLLAPVFAFFGDPNQKQIIVGAALFLVIIYLLKNSFLTYTAWKQTTFAYSLQHRIAKQLFETYLRQPYFFHIQKNSSELIRNITSEVNLFTFAINALMLILTEAFILLGIISILVYMEPLGAIAIVFVLSAASMLFIQLTKNRVLDWGGKRQIHDGLRLQHLQQGLGGIKEVKLYHREVFFLRQFNEHNHASTTINSKQIFLHQLPRLWLEFLAILGLSILITILIFKGYNINEIVPLLALFAAAAFRLMPSANRLIGALQTLRFNTPVIEMLSEELSNKPKQFSHTSLSKPNQFLKDEILFNRVSYSYNKSQSNAVNDITVSIKKGQSVGVIGPSGSGKSTLIDILLGLLLPDAGKLLVDGKDSDDFINEWQQQIGYVPQSIFLTDDSLLANIAFGIPKDKIDIIAVKEAVKASQLQNFVDDLDEGLETVVGERGVRLSGGQRQRIGIARALYHKPEVLVFDEATSALDTKTETDVMETINALHGKKTIIMVAHRLSTVMSCDKLYRLNSGRVIDHGSPEELVKVN